jgi:lipid-A-disaccharide synthase
MASVPSVLIVAAEASGALYAQRLLEAWRAEGRAVDAFGVGSRDMEALGFRCLGRSEEMAVVGLQEVLRHFPDIYRVGQKIIAEAERARPKVALLIDYPGFNLRLAKTLKDRLKVPIVYYVSPQVWAWKTGRVRQIRKYVDRMLVLFPFEAEFYKERGVEAEFVGHPLLDELAPRLFDPKETEVMRQKHGFEPRDLVLGLMPGSRRSEIRHHLMPQLQAARLLSRRDERIRPVLLVAPTFDREDFRPLLSELEARGQGLPIQIVKDAPFAMIQLCDAVLCASGTATLMVGLLEKPMVIMYRMSAITAFLARLLVTKTPFFGMVNLIMGRRAVSELFQEEASPQRMADEVARVLLDPRQREAMAADLRGLKDRLGSRGATERVARCLAGYLDA